MIRSKIIQKVLADYAKGQPLLTAERAEKLAQAVEEAILAEERKSLKTRPTAIVAAPVERDGVMSIESVETVTVKHGEARVEDGRMVISEDLGPQDEDDYPEDED